MPSASKPRPLYQSTTHALAEILRQAAPGSALPSEPRLARQLGVSRSTLREAMRPFEQRGLVTRRQGVGTFVARPSSTSSSRTRANSHADAVRRSLALMTSRASSPRRNMPRT